MHVIAVLIPVLAAFWHLATKLSRIETKLEPLKDLPERVARIEVRIDQ